MSTKTAEFLQRCSSHISESSIRDVNIPILHQLREKCLKTLNEGAKAPVHFDGNLGCKWCLLSWPWREAQYTVRLLPQKRPRGYHSLRAKFASDPEAFTKNKRLRKNLANNIMALTCDLCKRVTKIPMRKPGKPPKEEPRPSSPQPPPKKKRKKSKKRDEFVGLNPVAVRSSKQKRADLEPCEPKKVVEVVEVLSPSSIQNGVNIVSNRSKTRSQPSVSSPEKTTIIKNNGAKDSLKLTAQCKNKKKKLKATTGDGSKKKKVASALTTFLSSL